MTVPHTSKLGDELLPYGDGSNKVFGMENFGNTCYCNSILQCLFYTETFRTKLVSHNATTHDRKLVQNGVKPHNFTTKYEQLVAKRLKEQGSSKNVSTTAGGVSVNGSTIETNNGATGEERPKSSRKGSLFGIKFNSNSSTTPVSHSPSLEDSRKMSAHIVKAGNCDALSLDQKNKISKDKEFQQLNILITRPTTQTSNPSDRNDYSQSSSMLLNNEQPQQANPEGSISSTSSAVIVGIPQPETFLVNPINPFNVNPSSDQRKRSALINGPIINLDSSIRLPSEQNDDSALLYSLKDMFESMVENQSNTGVVSPIYFIQKLKEKNFLFRQNNMHHDAHEFFNYLINEIIESLNKEVSVENNWCNEIFQGMITNETKCLSCENVTSKHENFLDLSVDIPPGESAYSLSYSLNNFSKLEVLTNQNKFSCSTCSSLQEAVKTIKLKKLPEVLVINFKRFKYDEKVDKMVKLFDSISYPFNLRLFNTTDDEKEFTLYELYSLVIHIGGGPMHGHYVSICKVKSGLWLLFDDETVELVEDSYVMRFFGNGPGLASAYILFYTKCTTSTKSSEDDEHTINFGYKVDNVYNGGDYTLFQQFGNDSSESSFKKSHKDIEEEQEVDSDASSIASFTGPAATGSKEFGSELTLKKSGLFKKNFKFEGSKEEKPISRSGSIVEKKTWVGGLKRRESKAEVPMERKGSTSSSVGSNEKRKSIFGFKRK
ncbi:cysteine proteinase [Suhomyces tanzawaensis NRRL Y-17324]|uniref:Ubiquitin carboxyl-terminal hydrolase n=1 Tax=Suhomyces tanzawaensis NRRL Y-17324 TaxID=984487 RepID=A0A1E4SLN7_9ASCO|nr:cysteine proteinase [Suhomyces tanzawaensis NRRL Y-17324]ODV80439.1 cysteine proteinase [Suhomyces tanzawaensis NRRL Y-17324]